MYMGTHLGGQDMDMSFLEKYKNPQHFFCWPLMHAFKKKNTKLQFLS